MFPKAQKLFSKAHKVSCLWTGGRRGGEGVHRVLCHAGHGATKSSTRGAARPRQPPPGLRLHTRSCAAVLPHSPEHRVGQRGLIRRNAVPPQLHLPGQQPPAAHFGRFRGAFLPDLSSGRHALRHRKRPEWAAQRPGAAEPGGVPCGNHKPPALLHLRGHRDVPPAGICSRSVPASCPRVTANALPPSLPLSLTPRIVTIRGL